MPRSQEGEVHSPRAAQTVRTAFFVTALLLSGFAPSRGALAQTLTPAEALPAVGDQAPDLFPTGTLSPELTPLDIQRAMSLVAHWQDERIAHSPSRDWTFATAYLGLIAASEVLHQPKYRQTAQMAAEHFEWRLGPRQTHADDQAIGQVYLSLNQAGAKSQEIASLKTQFDGLLLEPDQDGKPVWWWCDALFMAPPVWSRLARVTGDQKYLAYMDREWHITADRLWDPQEHLFFRDAAYLARREKNGKKLFWSRGNGWVMGGIVLVLKSMPEDDPRRPYYVQKLREMADALVPIQGPDGLWRAGLLDADSYTEPETSGSSFFLYAMVWGMKMGILPEAKFRPVVQRCWAGLLQHVYADGRLGDVQPVGEAPGRYSSSSSYVFGVGAFLLGAAELNTWAASHIHEGTSTRNPVGALPARGVQR